MLSLALLLSIASVHAVGIPASVKSAAAQAETVAYSPVGREIVHQALKNLTQEEILVVANLAVINADDIAQVAAAVVSQLRDANKSHTVKDVSKTALKTFAREKAVTLINSGIEKAAEKAHISRPEFIKQNARLNYLVSLIYKEALRQTVDTTINNYIK